MIHPSETNWWPSSILSPPYHPSLPSNPTHQRVGGSRSYPSAHHTDSSVLSSLRFSRSLKLLPPPPPIWSAASLSFSNKPELSVDGIDIVLLTCSGAQRHSRGPAEYTGKGQRPAERSGRPTKESCSGDDDIFKHMSPR